MVSSILCFGDLRTHKALAVSDRYTPGKGKHTRIDSVAGQEGHGTVRHQTEGKFVVLLGFLLVFTELFLICTYQLRPPSEERYGPSKVIV